MDFVTFLGQVLAIIGAVEASKHLSAKVTGIITVCVALILGGMCGYFHLFGFSTLQSGLLGAFIAVGSDTTFNTIVGK